MDSPRPTIHRWVLSMIVSLAAACGQRPAPMIEDKRLGPQGALTIALSAEAESLDPYFVYQQAGASIVEALFDTLLSRGFDGEIVSGLAESWRILDNTTIELALRGGVSFHNGEPFNADSVKFSIERILDEELNSGLRSNYTFIESVSVVDELTVRLHLNRPDGTVFDRLTELYILPPGHTTEYGDEFIASNPVGTGPFKFVEWVRDDHLTLKANPDYWEGSWKGKPLVETVVFRPITEASTRVAELIVGGADIVQDLPPDQVRVVEQAGKRVSSSPTPNQTYFFVTADNPESPFNDVAVRRAINFAVDIESIIENLLGGYGVRIASPIGPSVLGYDPEVMPYRYDPVEARRLLAEAGYADGFSIVMDVATADMTDEALAVVGQLAEVGIRVQIRELELAQFNESWVSRSQSPIWRARWGTSPDPASIESFLSCEGSISRYCDAEITELIQEANSTLDQEERAGIYGQISRLTHENPVGIYGWTTTQLVGLASDVDGFRPHVSLAIIASNISLDR